MERSVLLGLPEKSNDSDWGDPPFPHLKPKTNLVHFLSDFGNLNEQKKRKTYPITNINEILLK